MQADTPTDSLPLLRAELRRQLALQQKPSLYAVLGIPADSSDVQVAEAIARQATAGTPADAETRYAMETLGNPQAREMFDRRLLDQLKQGPSVLRPAEVRTATGGHSGTVKLVAMVALVLGLGYLGLGVSRERTERELRLKEAQLREESLRKAAEIANRVVDHQQSVTEASAAAQERAAEARERALAEARMREDKYRLDQAHRQEQQTALLEQRRQQSEQTRLQAETRRKEAEAMAQTRAIRQQAIQDAIARGNYNEAERLRNLPY